MKKTVIKLGTLLLALSLVFVCAFTAACGNNNDNSGDNPPPAHTHTYATTWSKDDTNHWHAATCEHTTEKKDNAAHTLTKGTCSVCGYEAPKATLCTHDECPKCPDCGGCLDERCTIEGCIPCGHELTKHNEFVAGFSELSPGRNPTNPDETWALRPKDHTNCTHTELGIVFINGLAGNNGGKMTFKITSDKACTVTLRIHCAKSPVKSIMTEYMYFIVNNEILERETFITPPSAGVDPKEDLAWNNLGCIDLIAGENIIQIVAFSADPAVGYNMHSIDLVTEEDVTLSWTPKTHEENNIKICNK